MNEIDRTVIVDGELPKSWKCPHCGKRQTLSGSDNEIFMRYMVFIRHCDRCGYLHSWELELTDEFKKKVVDYLKEEMKNDKAN